MKTYEAVFILDSKKLEDNGEVFAKSAGEQIEALGGKVHKAVSLGRKQFARAIGRRRAANYWDLIIDLEPESVVALQDGYRLNETVLRLVVFNYREGSDPSKLAARQRTG